MTKVPGERRALWNEVFLSLIRPFPTLMRQGRRDTELRVSRAHTRMNPRRWLSIRVNAKVKTGFASSSHCLPLPHLHLSNAKNSRWLLSQDRHADAHRSSQIRPTTELCLSKTALKYCFHHTASRGYGHKAKKKRFQTSTSNILRKIAPKRVCSYAQEWFLGESNLTNCLWIV